MLLATFWRIADPLWLIIWVAVGCAMIGVRETHLRQFKATDVASVDLGFWTRRVERTLLCNGLYWGASCAAFAFVATPYLYPPVVLIVGGLRTGSVLASSYQLRAFACFSLPLLLLSLSAFLVLGVIRHPSLLATAAVLGVWSLFILLAAKRFGANYRRSIARGLDNLDLATSIEQKMRENETLNRSLREQIAELRSTQAQLVKEKDRADGLVHKLRALSVRDALTGLGNRRSFDGHLSREWRRAQRHLEPLALLLIDADHFKAYNDHYGHQAGDRCLQAIGDILASLPQRAGDWSARYGGEEFAVILAGTNRASAAALAERARAELVAKAIAHAASPTADIVTVSIGVACLMPTAQTSPEHLIKAADAALYAAKRQGRNCVVVDGAKTVVIATSECVSDSNTG